jgi:hypothetical protein
MVDVVTGLERLDALPVQGMTDVAPPGSGTARPAWSQLGPRAKAWRVVHATWAVAQMACLADVWTSAIRRRRSPRLWAGVAFLSLEGGALVVGHGNCPVGPRQAEWGDPVPFFELLLPPRAAKAAIPVLGVISLTGIGLLVIRRPGVVMRSPTDRP